MAILVFIFLIVLAVIQMAVFILVITYFVSGLVSDFNGAPYVPIGKNMTKKLLEFGGLKSWDCFYDLGCGDGRVLITASQKFNVAKAVGYEIAPWPYLKARIKIKHHSLRNIHIYRENFIKADIKEATFIFIYLFPNLVNKIAYKIENECGTGTKILCPSFPINTIKHLKFLLLKTQKIGNITTYLYQLA